MTEKPMPDVIWATATPDVKTTSGYWSVIDKINPNRSNKQPRIKYIRADTVPQWQPIETAPKDGTYFDVYTKYGRIINCAMDPQWGYIYAPCPETGNYNINVTDATHWMPLPKPPVDKDGL